MNKNAKLIAYALCFSVSMLAGDSPEAPAPAKSEIEQLKQMLLDQQKQIDELRRLLLAKDSPSNSANVTRSSEHWRSGEHGSRAAAGSGFFVFELELGSGHRGSASPRRQSG